MTEDHSIAHDAADVGVAGDLQKLRANDSILLPQADLHSHLDHNQHAASDQQR